MPSFSGKKIEALTEAKCLVLLSHLLDWFNAEFFREEEATDGSEVLGPTVSFVGLV